MGQTESRGEVHEVWKKQSLGTGLQGTIISKNTCIRWQCKLGASSEEEEVLWRTPQDHRAWFKRGFVKRIRSTSVAVGRTLLHIPLLTVKLHLAEEEIETVVDTGASALVVGKRLACKLGIWKRVREVKFRKEDGSYLVGNLVVHTTFKAMDSSSVLRKFAMDTEVLHIRNRDVLLEFSRLMENRFSVDTQYRCLRNVNPGQVIPCSVWRIPKVLIMEEAPPEGDKILTIIDARERYFCYVLCFSN